MSRKNCFLSKLVLIFMIAVFFTGCAGKSSFSSIKDNNSFLSINSIDKSPQEVFLSAWDILKEEYLEKNLNHQDWTKWKERYLGRIKTKEDSYVAINTMIESLNDPYTRFLSPYDFAEQTRSIDAKLFGIGVHIAKVKDRVVIIDVIADTPAKKAGLKPGDIILKVNNVSTKGQDSRHIADKVRGKANTPVNLLILRGKQQINFRVIRKEINLKSVEYKILKGNIAYIRISSFLSAETSSEMLKALKATAQAKGVIIDLRGNQGGLLPNAILIANMFMNSGVIVSMVDRDDEKKVIKADPGDGIDERPLIVLINQGSASASEILGGALRDNKRAILVGQKSFGKGLVQRVHRLPDGSGINITIAKYLTPNGTDINKKGIKPDYTVKFTEKDFLSKKDPQLDKAEQVLMLEVVKQKAITKLDSIAKVPSKKMYCR